MSIPAEWRRGEVAVIGLGRSGRAVAELLVREGARVYASDSAPAAPPDPLTGCERGSAAERADHASTVGELRRLGVDVIAGGHDLARIARATVVVASPGVPPEAPPLAAARAAGVTIVSEIDVALRALTGTRYIAVTGTNGKTTTTAIIGHLLRGLGRDATDAGNIGRPLSALALSPPTRAGAERWAAVELSSFQLHDTPSVDPAVGVLTNLAPDHLDRYANVGEYYADKALLFRNAATGSRWVLNADDAATWSLAATSGTAPGSRPTLRDVPGRSWRFSLRDPTTDAWYDTQNARLLVLGEPLLDRDALRLMGDHNVANALAASLAVMVADDAHATTASRASIAASLASFRALAHRLEPVGEADGVLWVNDSKATNVSSTLVAIEGMTRPTVLLLGGRHKGEPYTALAAAVRRIARAVVAYGEAAGAIEHDLAGVVRVERVAGSFDDVIDRATRLAQPGDALLLSPACSSYDMFQNY
ncbi:MAG: UDP-N-acetylmuramoyl-L-alanine--D-glutamate ligase, partial [Gemmatimonadaceae bacterium]